MCVSRAPSRFGEGSALSWVEKQEARHSSHGFLLNGEKIDQSTNRPNGSRSLR